MTDGGAEAGVRDVGGKDAGAADIAETSTAPQSAVLVQVVAVRLRGRGSMRDSTTFHTSVGAPASLPTGGMAYMILITEGPTSPSLAAS